VATPTPPPSLPPGARPHAGPAKLVWLLAAASLGVLLLSAWHLRSWEPDQEGAWLEAVLHAGPAAVVIALSAQLVIHERRLRRALHAIIARELAEKASTERTLERRTEQLTHADERFRLLADAAPVGIFHSGSDGRRFTNRRWIEISGLTQEQSVGDGWHEALHPEDRERVVATFAAAMRDGRRWSSEHRLVHHRTGEVRWVFAQAVPFHAAQEGSGYVGSVTDVTEQKLRERVLRLLSVDTVGLKPAEFYDRMVAELAAVCGMEIAVVCRLIGDPRERARTLAVWADGRPGPNFEYALGGTPCERILSSDFVHFARGVAALFPADLMLTELQVESYAAVPLFDSSGRPIGHLALLSRRPMANVERVESTLRLLAVRTAAELERESTEERFGALFEFAPDAIVLTDRRGTIRQVNQRAVELFGYTPGELVGQPVETLMPVEHRALHAQQREIYARHASPRAMGAGRPNLVARRKDGSVFPADISLGSLTSDDGVLMLAAIRDTTDKVRAAAALRESEEWLRTVFETTPECVQLLDRSGRILEINSTGVRMLGAPTANAARGQSMPERLEGESRRKFEEFLAGVFRGELRQLDYEVRQPGGARHYRAAYGAPMWENAQHRAVKSALVVTRDMTKEREVERAMQALLRTTAAVLGEEYLQSLVRALGETLGSHQVLLAVQESGRPGWLRTLAYFSDGKLLPNFSYDAEGGPCAAVIAQDTPIYLASEACSRFSRGVCGRQEVGGYYGMPLHDAARRPLGVLTVIGRRELQLDPVMQSLLLTFALRAEAELLRLQTEDERRRVEQQLFQGQKMEALGNLAGGVAHDFNNLLTGIINFTTLARVEAHDPARVQAHLEQVLAGSSRAKELVRQILMFSRQQPPRREPLQLERVVGEVHALLQAMVPGQIRLQVDIAPALPPVLGEATQMHQVLMNLCINAVHAMKAGGELLVTVVETTVSSDEARRRPALRPGRFVRLEVRDTGSGIDPALLPRIFEPFFSTKQVGEGSGLGLAVVHGIIQSHDGAITVESEPGKGTTFQVFLPIMAVAPAVPSLEPGRGGRVLLVDDEQTITGSLQPLLQAAGYAVTVCANAHEALAAFWAEPQGFDAVLTDLRMPGMSGAELAERLRAHRPDLPVAVMSGYLGEWSEEKLRGIGVRQILTKPLTADEVRAAVAALLAGAPRRKNS
jgi:PAS domain S-box-containing protein